MSRSIKKINEKILSLKKLFFFFKLIGLQKLQIKVSVLFQRDLLVSFPTDDEVIKS